jgi:GMP synthase-like glutamine amidotransferase
MPTCLVVQHLQPEAPYTIATALAEAGVVVRTVRVYAGDELPGSLAGYRGLVVMGGPMSAASDDGFPSRGSEVRLLREALDRRLPALGVCLGAQLLAVAAGSKVYAGANGPEIGWGPVTFTPEAGSDALLAGAPSPLHVLHWHGDTFDLPAGAAHLASSPMYPVQAFRPGPTAWGLQFHVEVDEAAVAAFVGSFGSEADAAGVPSAVISAGSPYFLAQLQPARQVVLSRFAALVAGAPGA